MQLSDYLESIGKTHSAFARELHVARHTLWRYATARRVPPPNLIARIWLMTGGQVGPRDWYELPPLDGAAGAADEIAEGVRAQLAGVTIKADEIEAFRASLARVIEIWTTPPRRAAPCAAEAVVVPVAGE